jgi:hypothetical protein
MPGGKNEERRLRGIWFEERVSEITFSSRQSAHEGKGTRGEERLLSVAVGRFRVCFEGPVRTTRDGRGRPCLTD